MNEHEEHNLVGSSYFQYNCSICCTVSSNMPSCEAPKIGGTNCVFAVDILYDKILWIYFSLSLEDRFVHLRIDSKTLLLLLLVFEVL